ncbi:hypothetical protein HPB49_005603 [Dermacentor silvarum]|uniref:Uncharacterized protein n=1 Tax=Dermacentor silvarum TaxID=543639 RepID=A0ACB8DWJ6_DERSI|nr:hypothetical protein HPB49_005603 [Dermacentor silvarum]
MLLIIRIRTDQNLAVISTSDENLATELQKVQSISLGLNQHAVQAYVAAPDNSCKGVVPGIEPNTTVKTLLENLRYSEASILHARMMGSTNQALVTFSGIQICSVCLSMGHRADVCPMSDKPRCVACGTSNPLPEHECTPKFIHCGGDHPATDPRCPSRQQRPFNKSYVLQERLKREKLCPPAGSAHSQPKTTAGSLRNPDQPTKTPVNSAEQPPTSERSSTHDPPGHDRQIDRGRPGNPSKERAAGSGHPKDHGQQKGAHNKEQTVPRLRILGLHIQADGKASHTTHLLTQQITQITHMIHRITNRRRGIREKDVLRIVQALIVSRFTYHLPYHNLTLTQTEKMDVLLRTAVKAALGLPPHASTRRLLQLGVHNTITELLEAQHNSQLQRLRRTRQGCDILSRLGYPIPEKPIQVPQHKLAPNIRALINVAPIPRNMNPHRHAGRRRARVQAMTRIFGGGTTDLQVLYTDAARYPEKPAMCLAVIDNTDALVASATLRTTDSGSAEEGAIALAIVHASTLPSQDAPVPIVTDSQAACRAFAQGLVAAHTHNITEPDSDRCPVNTGASAIGPDSAGGSNSGGMPADAANPVHMLASALQQVLQTVISPGPRIGVPIPAYSGYGDRMSANFFFYWRCDSTSKRLACPRVRCWREFSRLL